MSKSLLVVLQDWCCCDLLALSDRDCRVCVVSPIIKNDITSAPQSMLQNA